ncbi:MAG: tRNA dihydrouridine synthase DusB [Candidatus Nanoarchaeia archaeon]|nr:tRNA dihydrouridine synthase DusB [Candidatus Nanoarchaeia archaeon]MDD5588070.1 tRNA dihydrouridine synthase DusB [Candidatus Nanoarchaeia archaeon]
MNIKNLKLKNNLVLAPMVAINDQAFRVLCKKYDCGLVFTEMINANAIFKTNKATLKKLSFVKEEKPIAVQLFGANTKMIEFAAKEAEKAGADIIDFNFGCPDIKIIKQGAGAALLKRPTKIGEIIEAIVKTVNIPVTAKIRIGITKPDLGLKIAKIVEKAGASAIIVHARTAKQGYSGKADWNKIKEIKENVKIPVIGNGDVFSGKDAYEILEKTKCDGIMLGRAAMTNPAIFKEINYYLKNKKENKISNKEKLNLFFEYLELTKKYDCFDFVNAKRHALNFMRGMPNIVKLRTKVSLTKNIEDMKKEIKEFQKDL